MVHVGAPSTLPLHPVFDMLPYWHTITVSVELLASVQPSAIVKYSCPLDQEHFTWPSACSPVVHTVLPLLLLLLLRAVK